jgi:hypothetical protein
MALLKKSTVPKIDAAAVYLCLEGFATDAGAFRRGARLRGSHPAVQRWPLFWVEDGLADDEILAVHQARFPLRGTDGRDDHSPVRIAGPIPEERRMVCTKLLMVPVDWGDPLGPMENRGVSYRQIAPGDIVDSADPVVRKNRDSFEKAPPAA